VQAVERRGEREQRQRNARGDRRRAQPRDRAQPERIERKESAARRRRAAQVRVVAALRDHQVPRRIPARRGAREQIAEPAEAARDAWRVEGFAHGAKAEQRERSRPGEPHQRARAEQRARAVARGVHARLVGQQPRPSRAQRRSEGGAGPQARGQRQRAETGARTALGRAQLSGAPIQRACRGDRGAQAAWAGRRGGRRVVLSGVGSHDRPLSLVA
jgi:hypothetical protein